MTKGNGLALPEGPLRAPSGRGLSRLLFRFLGDVRSRRGAVPTRTQMLAMVATSASPLPLPSIFPPPSAQRLPVQLLRSFVATMTAMMAIRTTRMMRRTSVRVVLLLPEEVSGTE